VPERPQRPATQHDEVLVVDAEWRELMPDVLRIQRDTAASMAKALAAEDRKQLQFLAHRLYGGLATMGADWAAGESRALERGAMTAPLSEMEQRVRALRLFLERVRVESR
jgi:HPt (histidine-containing phosphotransfer) domain-containing protein